MGRAKGIHHDQSECRGSVGVACYISEPWSLSAPILTVAFLSFRPESLQRSPVHPAALSGSTHSECSLVLASGASDLRGSRDARYEAVAATALRLLGVQLRPATLIDAE